MHKTWKLVDYLNSLKIREHRRWRQRFKLTNKCTLSTIEMYFSVFHPFSFFVSHRMFFFFVIHRNVNRRKQTIKPKTNEKCEIQSKNHSTTHLIFHCVFVKRGAVSASPSSGLKSLHVLHSNCDNAICRQTHTETHSHFSTEWNDIDKTRCSCCAFP